MIYKLILLLISFGGFCIICIKHGEQQKGKYNAYTSLAAYIVQYWLLYKIGFFDFLQ